MPNRLALFLGSATLILIAIARTSPATVAETVYHSLTQTTASIRDDGQVGGLGTGSSMSYRGRGIGRCWRRRSR